MEARDDTPRRRAAVVVNPSKRGVDELRHGIHIESGRAGWDEPLWLETSVADTGAGAARRALEAGCDVVLAAGGDGTVRAVAEILRGSGVPLALVPTGTGNLLARNLGLPLTDIRACVRTALHGRDRAIDVGLAEATHEDGSVAQHSFLVIGGLGLDAAIIANTRGWLKKRVGWLAYVDGGFRALGTGTREFRTRYAIDDARELPAHVSTILVGNCGDLPGGLALLPDAAVDDGYLDIAVLQPRSVFGWLLVWRRVGWENRVLRRTALGRSLIRFTGAERSRRISYLRGRAVRVRVDEPQPFQLDGDEGGRVVAVDFGVDPSALLVRIPADERDQSGSPPRSPRSQSRASMKTSSA